MRGDFAHDLVRKVCNFTGSCARDRGAEANGSSSGYVAIGKSINTLQGDKNEECCILDISTGFATVALLIGASGTMMAKDYVKGERPQQRGYSLAVVTEGGKTIWLAGQTASVDDQGKSLAGDFEGQVRQLFKQLDATLQKAGGKLSDMVQMTVFITDVRNGDKFTQIRREILGDNFPGSAMITITALADPNAKLEIQGYAVVGSK